jgi:hypothetical protein
MTLDVCAWCYARLRVLRHCRIRWVRLWSAPRTVRLTDAYCSRRCARAHAQHG